MNTLQILSFVGFTLLVALITWWKVRKTDTGSQQGYFLAGRSLKAPVIAASLMLTNLSTEQLVGLSGQAYKSGMSVMGWEVTSAVTLIFLALFKNPLNVLITAPNKTAPKNPTKGTGSTLFTSVGYAISAFGRSWYR